MTSFIAISPEQVDEFYQTAIDNGATCEGNPGQRPPEFYIVYLRDLEWIKFADFNFTGELGEELLPNSIQETIQIITKFIAHVAAFLYH